MSAEVYINEEKNESVALLLSNDNKVAYYLHFKIDKVLSKKAATFTAYNELEEPIMSGIYDTEIQRFEITDVYNNDVITRASARAWGCNLAIGVAGGIWSVAAGMVSMGAGFIVGLS